MKRALCIVVSSPMTVDAFLKNHVSALQQRYRVTIAANAGGGRGPELPGIEFVDLPIERRPAPLRDAVALVRLHRLFRRHGYGAVHSVTPKAGLLAMLAARMARVPVRVHVFTGQVWATRSGAARRLLRGMDRLIARCATHVLVDSPSQRDFLVAEGVVEPGKARVLGKGSIAGVDPARFRADAAARAAVRQELGWREDDVVFVFLGRLNRDKGVLDLASAFARVPAGESRLLVIGPDEGGLRAAMRERLGAAASRAAFLDYSERPERYLAGSDVLCLPSYREGFGSVILEAAACGVPSIGSRIYGITDAIEDGVTGLLHPPGDTGALARHMERLVRDPALRGALGARARETARRDFPAAAITGALVEFYAGVLGGSSGDDRLE